MLSWINNSLTPSVLSTVALSPTFEATVTSAQTRDTLISYDDLVALLLGAELRMKSHSSLTLDASPTTLYASTQSVSLSQGYNNRGCGTSFRGRRRERTNSSSSSSALPPKTEGVVVCRVSDLQSFSVHGIKLLPPNGLCLRKACPN